MVLATLSAGVATETAAAHVVPGMRETAVPGGSGTTSGTGPADRTRATTVLTTAGLTTLALTMTVPATTVLTMTVLTMTVPPMTVARATTVLIRVVWTRPPTVPAR